MATPQDVNHIIITGENNTSRFNMANSVNKIQKISYRTHLVVDTFTLPLPLTTNYIFITQSLKLIPLSIQKKSVILSKPLVCI